MERKKTELTTLRRGLDILSLFSEGTPALDTSAVAERMEMSKSTAYKYVQTLETAGFLVRAEDGRSFKLGPSVLELTSRIPKASALVDVATPLLKGLVDQTNETVVLTTIMGTKAVCLAREESGHSLKLTYEIGATYPLHAGASALVLLAAMETTARARLLRNLRLDRYTDRTIVDRKALAERIEQITEDGYAVSTGELSEGVFAVAAPVSVRSGDVLASLAISGPLHRFDLDKQKRYVKLVVSAARDITKLAG